MKWNMNVVVGLVIGLCFTAAAGLGWLSYYLENHRTVELPPPCEVNDLSPRDAYSPVVLHIPNAYKCGTPAALAALNTYVDFSNYRADIRNRQFIVDVERAGYLFIFDSSNDYWRRTKGK